MSELHTPEQIVVNGVTYQRSADDALTASYEAGPVAPPAEWFERPADRGSAYDVVIEGGRVHGYPAATWDTCHLSFSDQCVTPPRTASGYRHFKVGSVLTADGQRIATGPLTLRGGHAGKNLSAASAQAFYDDTNSAFADVAIGEDQYGIWIAGAIRPDARPEAIRAAMGSGFSGDWRFVEGNYELIALSAVNTPGFRRKVSTTERDGMVASMTFDMPRTDAPGNDQLVVANTIEYSLTSTVEDQDAVLASAVARIAKSIGRSPEQRIDELLARVHGEAVAK